MRTSIAIGTAKLSGHLSRLRGGGATSVPGVVGLKIQPKLVRELRKNLGGSVVVTGTNGKTTTSRFIGESLKAAGKPYVHNQSGSNLLRGIASTLIQGHPHRGTKKPWGLFEVDEATMPAACLELAPKVVVVTNLFRDQLDRYGELQRTADYLREGLASLPKSSVVVLNADDPLVASLGQGLPQTVMYYGIEDTSVSKDGLPRAADHFTTPTGQLLRYEAVFTGHLGHYRSPDKSLKRPKPSVAVTKLELDGTTGSDVQFKLGRKRFSVRLGIPGIYNAYNAAAAVAAGHALGLSPTVIEPAIARTAAAFGRVEHVQVGNKEIFIGLIKNPTGANEVIHTLSLDKGKKDFLILINDNFADGTDVSWLWDADFEEILPQARSLAVSGTRTDDMALRLKYAGVKEADVTVRRDIGKALEAALEGVPDGGTLYVLPTYTAMLELRRQLVEQGHLKHYLS
ncbi:Mur ligase family protein [Patescibacteria group bacterium]|nr:Mur ligase family protein [Patescibacteria group bacterium]